MPAAPGRPRRAVTVRDAIGDLPPIENGADVVEMPFSGVAASPAAAACRVQALLHYSGFWVASMASRYLCVAAIADRLFAACCCRSTAVRCHMLAGQGTGDWCPALTQRLILKGQCLRCRPAAERVPAGDAGRGGGAAGPRG